MNDMIQANVEQGNLDSSIFRFYSIKYNSQSDY
jgi:hypothetical protein